MIECFIILFVIVKCMKYGWKWKLSWTSVLHFLNLSELAIELLNLTRKVFRIEIPLTVVFLLKSAQEVLVLVVVGALPLLRGH